MASQAQGSRRATFPKQQKASVATLSDELVVEILRHTQPDFIHIRPEHLQTQHFVQSIELSLQKKHFELPHVSSRIRHLISSHPTLPLQLVLQPSSQLKRGVRDRVNHHNGAIWMTAYGEPKPMQEFLNELVLSADKLERLSLGNPTKTHMQTLPCFSNLAYCQLHKPTGPDMDLTPLLALKHLHDLDLQYGVFSQLHITSGLTALSLRRSTVSTSRSRQISLKQLALNDSSHLLMGPDKSIVPLCTTVTQLDLLGNACNMDQANHFNGLPVETLSLPLLTDVSIFVGIHKVCMEEFDKLPALRSLVLHVRGGRFVGDVACL